MAKRIYIDDVMKRKLPPLGRPPVVCIGASAGGTIATTELLAQMPLSAPGIVVVQHIPQPFSTSYAKNLDMKLAFEVLEAETGMMVQPGRVIIARGGQHMSLRYYSGRYYVGVFDGPRVNYHRPSVDVLFRSAANVAGASAIGVILTGMGDDGARGIQDLDAVGAKTIAQDEASSMIFGMPKVAIKLTPSITISPLSKIASEIAAPKLRSPFWSA